MQTKSIAELEKVVTFYRDARNTLHVRLAALTAMIEAFDRISDIVFDCVDLTRETRDAVKVCDGRHLAVNTLRAHRDACRKDIEAADIAVAAAESRVNDAPEEGS